MIKKNAEIELALGRVTRATSDLREMAMTWAGMAENQEIIAWAKWMVERGTDE